MAQMAKGLCAWADRILQTTDHWSKERVFLFIFSFVFGEGEEWREGGKEVNKVVLSLYN